MLGKNKGKILPDALFRAIESYILENLAEEGRKEKLCARSFSAAEKFSRADIQFCYESAVTEESDAAAEAAELKLSKRSLADLIKEREETFAQSLFRIIDQKGLKDVDVYKKANIDRKLFSKIRSDKDYKPSKNTAVLFAFALCLSVDETLDLIGRAGFTLSMSSKSDLIIRFFIERGNYGLYDLNEALSAFGQAMIGF